MITILSPAKRLNLNKQDITSDYSIPVFLNDSIQLVDVLRKYSAKRLAILMNINAKLAQENFERFQEWQPVFDPTNAKQAILTFSGDVYNGLAADTFDADTLKFCQDHLFILSGLHGVLRSLDLIQPYRLEMGTPLETGRKKNLYEFWGDKITNELSQLANDGVLINLASNEYFKTIDANIFKGKIITPTFKEGRDGTYKFVHIFGKKARGLMAKFIVKNRIDDPEQIKLFDMEGYYYNDRLSKDNEWVFTRG